MKAKLTILVFSLIILTPFKIYSQDFNLFNPGNELYLFSAYDEGANAFRYNPAVLGLGHRLNITLNAFVQNYMNRTSLNELDLLVNSGSVGLGVRSTIISDSPYVYNRTSNTYSLGFGIGNKSFSIGA